MSNSSDVNAGDDALALQYNNLRKDVLNATTGHNHEGVEGKVLGAGALGTNSVETLKIKDSNVTAVKLASNSVETAKIKDANVTAAKLASYSVETIKIKDLAVTTAKILDEAVTLDKIKLVAASYSEAVAAYMYTAAFSISHYSHQVRIKSSLGGGLQTLDFAQCTGDSYQTKYKIKNDYSAPVTLYAYWYYHSNSRQAIWGIWDEQAKKLIAVLVEEDDGEQKLFPEEKPNQKVVKFKNPEKFLKIDTEEKKAKIKEKTMAGYILEDIVISEEDIEEIK